MSAADSLAHYLQALQDSLSAEIAVAFRDLESGQEFFFNEKIEMHAASTMKVAVMIEVFRQAETGRFRLEDSLVVANSFKSIVDGSPYSLDIGEDSDDAIYAAIGSKMSIRQLTHDMITVSSNLATNILIGLAGAANVMKTLEQLEISSLKVLRGVEDLKAFRLGMNNTTNAIDLMRCLVAIAEDRAASANSCREMIDILQAQKFREKIPARLPSGWMIGNKTGSITGIEHDCALIFPPGHKPCALAILTRGIATPEHANTAIAEIAARLCHTFIVQHHPVSSKSN